jgi:hypothetical protein
VIRWFAFERRWREELCAAAIPRVDGSDLPGYDQADTDAFWQRFGRTADPTFQLGLRAAVWVLTLAPLATLGRPRLFGKLPAHVRDARLVDCLEHRARPIRDLAGVLRLAACMAYFDDQAVRTRVLVGGGK